MSEGRKHQYEIQRSDRRMQFVVALFQAEKNRYEQLLTAIKKEIDQLAPPPQAVWIQTVPRKINEPLDNNGAEKRAPTIRMPCIGSDPPNSAGS